MLLFYTFGIYVTDSYFIKADLELLWIPFATKLHRIVGTSHSYLQYAYFMVYRFQFKFLLVHITPLIFDNANEVCGCRILKPTCAFMVRGSYETLLSEWSHVANFNLCDCRLWKNVFGQI